MIRAIVKRGMIQPVSPLPPSWSEGQELIVGPVTAEAEGETSREDESARRVEASASADEWCARFDAWAASHRRLACEADDSRDSIYAGRDE